MKVNSAKQLIGIFVVEFAEFASLYRTSKNQTWDNTKGVIAVITMIQFYFRPHFRFLVNEPCERVTRAFTLIVLN